MPLSYEIPNIYYLHQKPAYKVPLCFQKIFAKVGKKVMHTYSVVIRANVLFILGLVLLSYEMGYIIFQIKILSRPQDKCINKKY